MNGVVVKANFAIPVNAISMMRMEKEFSERNDPDFWVLSLNNGTSWKVELSEGEAGRLITALGGGELESSAIIANKIERR